MLRAEDEAIEANEVELIRATEMKEMSDEAKTRLDLTLVRIRQRAEGREVAV